MTRRRTQARPPAVLVGLAALATLLFALPLAGLLSRTPWVDLPALLAEPAVVDALRLSMITSVIAAATSLVLGVPLAWVLARVEFPGRSAVRALVTLPMVLPPVVGGAALLFAFGRQGLLGEVLYEEAGLLLPYSMWGVVLANTFVALPFLVITVDGALANLDPRVEQAAATLGASRWAVFRHVTLPMLGPSLAAGTVLAWARALGEFGATITFAGNTQGRTQTLPLSVFVTMQHDRDTAVAMSLVLVAVSFTVLVVLRGRWWGRR